MRHCKKCGKELQRHQTSYCSRACNMKSQTFSNAICGVCGKEFPREHQAAKYCGDECRAEAARRHKNGWPQPEHIDLDNPPVRTSQRLADFIAVYKKHGLHKWLKKG